MLTKRYAEARMIVPELIYLGKLAVTGAVGGALFGAFVMFLGLTFNVKRVRTIYQAAGIPITAEVYRAAAVAFGGMGAVLLPLMPILDANGMKDPWYGLSMMAAMAPFGIMFARRMKKLRAGSTAP